MKLACPHKGLERGGMSPGGRKDEGSRERRGMGTGGEHTLAQKAMEEEKDVIRKKLDGVDIVFLLHSSHFRTTILNTTIFFDKFKLKENHF